MRTVRTPHSLKWLIEKKARITGQIEYLEKPLPIYLETTRLALEKAESQVKILRSTYKKSKDLQDKGLPKLRAQLKAINIVLGIHEVQINQDLITPIKPIRASKLPHGQVNISIFEFFRVSHSINRREATTREITAFLATKFKIQNTEISLVQLTLIVRARLKNLVQEGRMVRNRNYENCLRGTIPFCLV